MKSLWAILLVIPLFAQITEKEIIVFNSGSKLNGELISINLNQKINPNTDLPSEIIFKPYIIEDAPKVFVRGKINNGNFLVFDPKDVYLIQFKKQFVGTHVLFDNNNQLEYKDRTEVEKSIKIYEELKLQEKLNRAEKRQLSEQKMLLFHDKYLHGWRIYFYLIIGVILVPIIVLGT